MNYVLTPEYFTQRIQCPREAKQDCLPTVRQLVELAFIARQQGLLKMDEMVQDYARYPDPFLRKAVNLVVETSDEDNIRKVLYNYILSTKHTANFQFLNEVIIAETMLALSRSEDLEFIFNYLVPSYFGIEYESSVVNVYQNFKKQVLLEQETDQPQ